MSELENPSPQEEPADSRPEAIDETPSDAGTQSGTPEVTQDTATESPEQSTAQETPVQGGEQASAAEVNPTAAAPATEPSTTATSGEPAAADAASDQPAGAAEQGGASGSETPAADQSGAPEGAAEAGADAGAADTKGAARTGARAWRPPRLSRDEMKVIWDELSTKKESGEQIELEVVGHNRGGVVTQYKGVEVFIPMSHWSLERQPSEEAVGAKVGSRVDASILEITDFETDARRVTATRRGTLRKGRLGSFAPGDKLTGRVSSIHDFGVFVDLGGIDGLVHASEISHVRGRRPSEMLTIGDEVEVVVREIDQERERIYLGMKELGPSPWDNVEETYKEGEIYKGKVVGFSKNGAFVELEPGIEGFIRLRELSWTKRAQRPKEILKKGADIDVKVLDVSAKKQRLGLSYRQAIEDPWPTIGEKYGVGTNWNGEIKELSNKGVVIDIGEVEGFLPRGRMGREAKRLPDMKAGEKLDVQVIEIDPSRYSIIFAIPGEQEFGGGGQRGGGEFAGGENRGGGESRGGFGGGENRGGGGFGGGSGAPREGGGQNRGGGGGPRGGGGPGGPRSGGGDRGGAGGAGGGERRDRGDRRDRDRDRPPMPAIPPSNELKDAGNSASFSIGDLLNEAVKRQLGIQEEAPQPQEKPKEQREKPQASAPVEQGTPAGAASDPSEQTPSGPSAESGGPGGVTAPVLEPGTSNDDASGTESGNAAAETSAPTAEPTAPAINSEGAGTGDEGSGDGDAAADKA